MGLRRYCFAAAEWDGKADVGMVGVWTVIPARAKICFYGPVHCRSAVGP